MDDPSPDQPRRRSAKSRRRSRAPGTAPPDPERLAERFLDLWQDQLAAIATDPDLAELVARLWTQWLVGPSAWRPMAAAAPDAETAPRPSPHAPDAPPHDAAAQAPGAAPAAAPSRDPEPDVGHLRARLGALEKRLAALERVPRGRRSSPERRSRRR
jgi:hypothetical protein